MKKRKTIFNLGGEVWEIGFRGFAFRFFYSKIRTYNGDLAVWSETLSEYWKLKEGEQLKNFKDYQYQRPNLELLENEFNALINKFERAKSPTTQASVISKINQLRNHFESMYVLVWIHHQMDTTKQYYDTENQMMDEAMPVFEGLTYRYYESLINAKYRKFLEAKYGKQLFRIAEIKLFTFSPDIVDDLQIENKLVSQYFKLQASAKFTFEGKERNIPQLVPFFQSLDRETRKNAWEAYTGFYLCHEAEFDEIFDQLVKIRHKIARKLGFDNFIELAYARLARTDYDAAKVAGFRKQIFEDVVPLVVKLKERQRKRLGLETLKYYDGQLNFLTGNATPLGDSAWIIDNVQIMYQELAPETQKFFALMFKNNLLDLDTRIGKVNLGFFTFMPQYKLPFIFANFNGTSHDIVVLTHEFGHAFQWFLSSHLNIPEYFMPTTEVCEIYSQCMEMFTFPWMSRFFGVDATKYQFAHLSDMVISFSHGALGDEFQHWVYEHDEATPTERKQIWHELQKKYLPYLDCDDNDLYNRGGSWLGYSGFFATPFYYIDYALANVCVFQLWVKSQQNWDKTWHDYLKLCKLGGSQSFLELIKIADIKSPFEKGSIKSILEPIKQWLDKVDDIELS